MLTCQPFPINIPLWVPYVLSSASFSGRKGRLFPQCPFLADLTWCVLCTSGGHLPNLRGNQEKSAANAMPCPQLLHAPALLNAAARSTVASPGEVWTPASQGVAETRDSLKGGGGAVRQSLQRANFDPKLPHAGVVSIFGEYGGRGVVNKGVLVPMFHLNFKYPKISKISRFFSGCP